MRHVVIIAAAGALLATPAAAESLKEQAKSVGETTGANSALGIAPTTKDFVKEATIAGMFEVESSKLALEQTQGPTKDFAQQMIKDHSETADQMKPLAEAANAEMPTALDSTHQKKLDELKKLKGDAFAKQYHEDQDSGHKTAVSLFERYSKGGENPELKSFAAKTLPHLQEHLKMAENLDK